MTEDSTLEPRRLARSQEGRLITGVCAGLGRYTGIDPLVFRVAFSVLTLTTGLGVPVYLAAYLLMAGSTGAPSKIEQLSHRMFDGDTVLALLGVVLGLGTVFGVMSDLRSSDPIAAVIVFAVVLLVARSRGADLPHVVRTLPERLKGRPLATWTSPARGYPPRGGMVDLARFGAPGQGGPPYPPAVTGHGLGAAPPPPRSYLAREQPVTAPGSPFAAPPAPPRPRSYLAPVALLVALLAAAAMFPAATTRTQSDRVQVMCAAALAVVGLGLLVGAWFGRDRRLITAGTMLSLVLAGSSVAGDPAVSGHWGSKSWRPVDAPQAEQRTHKVVIGTSTVDLSSVPLRPGARIRVRAEVKFGELRVTVPRAARVEVHGRSLLGDITVDRRITSGPNARVERVLEPERPSVGAVSTIELDLRVGIGDMEVSRVPA